MQAAFEAVKSEKISQKSSYALLSTPYNKLSDVFSMLDQDRTVLIKDEEARIVGWLITMVI